VETKNFFNVDSFSESRAKNEYAFQKILTSILFELFDFEVEFYFSDCLYFSACHYFSAAGDAVGDAVGAGDTAGDAVGMQNF
jgi:hypothetical protein